MYHTERKYWRNGFERRPYELHNCKVKTYFWSYTFHIGALGIMLCKPSKYVPLINLYILD